MLLFVVTAMGSESVAFSLVAAFGEAAIPDVRMELAPGQPVQVVLSWPVVPWSPELCAFPGARAKRPCRYRLLLEPFVEPQVRISDGAFRWIMGSGLTLGSRGVGPSVEVAGGLVIDPTGPGFMVGLMPGLGPARDATTRGRVGLSARWVHVPGGDRFDLNVDWRFPIAGGGWGSMLRGQGVEPSTPSPCVRRAQDERVPEPEPTFRIPEPERDVGCDPYGCGPGMCGEFEDGCGGTMSCGPCEPEPPPSKVE